MTEDSRLIEIIAFHEAGHALVAWVYKVTLFEIVVDIADGICKHKNLIGFLLDPKFMSEAEWFRVEKFAQILMGGEIAQRIIDPNSVRADFEGDSDRLELNDMARQLFPDCRESAFDWMKDMEKRAENIVCKHWEGLETLACELIVHRRLCGEAATKILEGASQGTLRIV